VNPHDNGRVFDHAADKYAQHFANKTLCTDIRLSAAAVLTLVIADRSFIESLKTVEPVTTAEVMALLKKVPAKHCSIDRVLTRWPEQIAGVIGPVIAKMFSASND
jgi:hypothetical protein